MKLHLWLLSFCVAVSACSKVEQSSTPAEPTFTIPTDPGGVYVVLEKGGAERERIIVTKREGPSGTTYSKRLFNCEDRTVKYLGTGDTMAAMRASFADPEMTPVQNGSIAYYLGLKACA